MDQPSRSRRAVRPRRGAPPSGGSADWAENTAGSRSRSRSWAELWRARELVWFFALRDLRVRYKQAVLGVAWVVLQPVAAVAAFTLVFDRLAGVGSQGVPYPLFALAGLVAWTYFSSTVSRASMVLVGDSALITKVYFPRLAAPTGAVLPPVVDLGVSLGLVAVLMAYYGHAPSWQLLALPVWLLVLVLTSLGVSLWLAALNVKYRDVQEVVAPLLQLWLFVSPVTYPATLLSGWQELVYALNPMAGVIGLGRWSMLGTPWPGWPLAVSLCTGGLVLAGGIRYFRHVERSFADVI